MPRKPAEPRTVPATVTRVAMAKFLGLTDRWVHEMIKDGTMVLDENGKLPFSENVQRYHAKKIEEVTSKAQPTGGDKLKERREAQIAMRMDIEQRKLVVLPEAQELFAKVVGVFLEALSGLPARLTRNLDERRRIEAIIDAERKRLSGIFEKHGEALRTGGADDDAVGENDT